MLTLFRKRRSADEALQDLVEGLSGALGPRLLSVIMYGSKASGEYRRGLSDVNVFILLENAARETLELLAKPLRTWLKEGHALPVFVPQGEVPFYAKNLPIEFLDMQDHHRVLFGSNPLEGLQVDRTHLRAQCAQELSVKLLKLRQGIVLAQGQRKRLQEMLLAALPSILTLYRAVLRIDGNSPKGSKLAAALHLARIVDFDGACLERLSEIHMRRQADNMEDLAHQFLAGVERVLAYVSRGSSFK